jgi:hypothetical protein
MHRVCMYGCGKHCGNWDVTMPLWRCDGNNELWVYQCSVTRSDHGKLEETPWAMDADEMEIDIRVRTSTS